MRARVSRALGVAAVIAAMSPSASAFWPLGMATGLRTAQAASGAARSHRCGQGGVNCHMSILDGLSAKDIDGKLIDLGEAYGQAPAVVVVNVATD
mmetsp:Transcript_43653/g.105503  ORF Transcript_43653/g.105503 Transcript_43653/m.105503 type:complete len:95 (+) Transcript_43653:46-330(+)